MWNRIGRHLTFANVVAVIALFVALGGSVYAAGKLNGKTIKPNSIPGNRLKANGVTGAQVDEGSLGPVPNAVNATNAANATNAVNATNAANAANAANAVSADSAQPVAFAHLLSDNTRDAANSKNVGSVIRNSQGVYCISGVPFTPRGGQATVDITGTTDQFAQLKVHAVSTDCPADPNVQAVVFTRNANDGTFVDSPFYVVLYG
jgi:hypothetical protein